MKCNITRQILTWLPALLFVFPAHSQSSVWKVKADSSVLFLGGSIHLLREQDYPLPEQFDNAFDQSEVLVLETDINPEDMVNIRSKILGMTLYPNDKSLKTELREDVYEKLDSAFQKSGIALSPLNGLKPVMAILTLTGIEWQKMGLQAEGVDKHFYMEAQKEKKDIFFLEEIEEQIRIITQMGEGTEDDFVLMSLKDLDDSRERTEELIKNWKEGNQKIMDEQLVEFKQMYPEVYKSLLTERNDNWMLHINQYMKTPETEFVVVGAMHLYGPDGLLKKLQEMGYQTESYK